MEIAGDERIARVLRRSQDVAKSLGRVKYQAFMPAPDHETSVFRVTSLSDNEIREIAYANVPEKAKNGSAIFSASAIRKTELSMQAIEPPPRHANIINWSMDEDPQIRKSKRQLAASILAEESKWLPDQLG
ncbi:MAG: hypothetical protein ABJQ93_05310 [Luteolibacter sp.]